VSGPGPGPVEGTPATRHPEPVQVGPVPLTGGDVVLRHPRYDDFAAWREVRLRNQRAVQRFWPTTTETWDDLHGEWRWLQQVADHRDAARAGSGIAFVIEVGGRFAGQLNLTGIDPVGRTAELGVWADQQLARRHVALVAVCAAFDLALTRLDLLSVTAPGDTRNRAALALAHHIGMTREATMRGYSHVDGQWRDHHLMTVLRGDRPAEGFLAARLGDPDLAGVDLVRPGRPLDAWPASWRGRGDLARHRLRGVRSRWSRRGASADGVDDHVLRLDVGGQPVDCGVRDVDGAHRIGEVYVEEPSSVVTAAAGVRHAAELAFGELELHRVTALATPGDVLRAEAYATAGLRHEGTLRARLLPDGSRGDLDLWAALVDDDRP